MALAFTLVGPFLMQELNESKLQSKSCLAVLDCSNHQP